jgi:hypothetical protein
MTYLRSYVTESNDAILNEVGRTTTVSPVRAHHGLGGASGHSFGQPRGPAGNVSLWVGIIMTSQD